MNGIGHSLTISQFPSIILFLLLDSRYVASIPIQDCFSRVMIEADVPVAEDTIEAASDAIDPLPLVKEVSSMDVLVFMDNQLKLYIKLINFQHLVRLSTSALNEQWTASLRSQLKPLITLNPHPNCTQFSAAEVAVQIDILEQKVPEELKKLLKEMKREHLAELLISDWLEEEITHSIESTNGVENLCTFVCFIVI